MKKLAVLLCLLPLAAAAQSTTYFDGGLAASAPLLRTYAGSICARYPGRSFRRDTEGTVKMTFTVGTNGRVTAVNVTGSSNASDMDDVAQRCVKSWEFIPPLKDGKPTEITTDTMVTFSRIGDYDSEMTWKTPLVRLASDVASQAILNQALLCMQASPGLAEQVGGKSLVTGLRVLYARGEVSRVSISLSSGNTALDKVAVDCFMNVAKDAQRAEQNRSGISSFWAIPWLVVARGGAQPAPAR